MSDNNKDVSQESFILIRFAGINSTQIIDTKLNNIDEIQMVGAAQMLELVARNAMITGLNKVKTDTIDPPKLYKPN
jgi:hypothetical protein